MVTTLLFSPKYPPYTGGSSQYFPNLADSLSDEHTMCVLTAYHPSKPLVTRDEGQTVYRVMLRDNRVPAPVRIILETLFMFVAAVGLILIHGVDVVHSHSTSYATPALGLAAVVTRTPIVYDCRDENFPKWAVRLGDPTVLFSCAPNIDDELIAAGFSHDQILRVPAVNPAYVSEYEREQPGGPATGQFDVLFVGYLKPVKNARLVVDGFAKFLGAHPDAHLTIVGDGELREDIEDAISTAGIESAATMTGAIDHRTTLEHIAGADTVVLPSSSEGDPRVVREAMQIGTPVVATPVGTVPDLIDDSESGLLVDESAVSVAAALERLYEDPALRERIATAAMETSEQWTWETLCERVTDGYERAIDG